VSSSVSGTFSEDLEEDGTTRNERVEDTDDNDAVQAEVVSSVDMDWASERRATRSRRRRANEERNSRGKNETSCNLSVSLVKGTVGGGSCVFGSGVVVYDRSL